MFRFALLVFLLGTAGWSVAEPLSFEAALDLATRSSPDVAVQTASVAAAQSASVAAGRLPDPKLTFGIENLPVTGEEKGSLTRDFMTMRKVGLMQDFPNSGKRTARSAAAVADADRARAQRRVSILTVRRDTALAWLARYYLERQGALLDDLDRENQLFAQTVEAQLAGGRGMPADARSEWRDHLRGPRAPPGGGPRAGAPRSGPRHSAPARGHDGSRPAPSR